MIRISTRVNTCSVFTPSASYPYVLVIQEHRKATTNKELQKSSSVVTPLRLNPFEAPLADVILSFLVLVVLEYISSTHASQDLNSTDASSSSEWMLSLQPMPSRGPEQSQEIPVQN